MYPASTKAGGANVTASPIDVCKMPTPGGPVPVPYANMVDGLAAGGDEAAQRTQKKLIDDAAQKGYGAKSATAAAIAGRSLGDEAGTLKGLVSTKNMGKTSYKTGSSKVKAEGQKVVHHMSPTAHNAGQANLPPGQQVAPSQTKVIIAGG